MFYICFTFPDAKIKQCFELCKYFKAYFQNILKQCYNMAVKERLISFLEYKGISKSEFGRIIGVSSAFVTSMRKSIQPDKVESIAFNFPELNIKWLMTGEGEMLKQSNNANSIESSEELSSLKHTIQTQSVAINALNKAIELQELELKRRDIDLQDKEQEIFKLKAEIQRLQRANEGLEAL